MCSICKRVRVVLHPRGRTQSTANISLCNLLLAEIEAEQRLLRTDVETTLAAIARSYACRCL